MNTETYCNWQEPQEIHTEIGNLMAFRRYNTEYDSLAAKGKLYNRSNNTTSMSKKMRFSQVTRINSSGYIMTKF